MNPHGPTVGTASKPKVGSIYRYQGANKACIVDLDPQGRNSRKHPLPPVAPEICYSLSHISENPTNLKTTKEASISLYAQDSYISKSVVGTL